MVLNLSATEKTWLSITSDGKQIFSGVLQPSQTKTLTGLEAAKLRVGNAGGLEVRWNGKPIGPIGPRGQVRVILFTPENFTYPDSRRDSLNSEVLKRSAPLRQNASLGGLRHLSSRHSAQKPGGYWLAFRYRPV